MHFVLLDYILTIMQGFIMQEKLITHANYAHFLLLLLLLNERAPARVSS